MKRGIAILILIVFTPCITFAQRQMRFLKEELDFSLTKDTFSLSGFFYFQNRGATQIEQQLFFPFPKGEMQNISGIKILDEQFSPIEFKETKDAIVFPIHVLPFDTLVLNIGYRQKVVGNKVSYIISSTQSWGEPLKSAEYTVTVDSCMRSLRSPILPKKSFWLTATKYIIGYTRTFFRTQNSKSSLMHIDLKKLNQHRERFT